jgi:hypothetical protein
MIRHPSYRELGERTFRRHYPRMIAAHSNAYRLIENYYYKHHGHLKGVADFEAHLAGIYVELHQLRTRYAYLHNLHRLIGPLWNLPFVERLADNLKGLKYFSTDH